MGTTVQAQSHPTVGVAHFGSNVSDRLSSSREELPDTSIIHQYNGFRTSVWKRRSVCASIFFLSRITGNMMSS